MKIPNYSPQVECQSAHPYLNLSFNSRNGVRKRHRTHFTNQQVEKLESIFKQTTNPNRDLVVQLSTLLNLTDKNISIWFKNRRAKCRREQSSNKTEEKVLIKSSVQKSKAPVAATWSEQMTYQSFHGQGEMFSDVKSLSTGLGGDTVTSKDVRPVPSYYESTEEKSPKSGLKEIAHVNGSYDRHTPSTCYPVPTSYWQYVPGSIEAPSKSVSTASISSWSRPISPYDQWRNITPTMSSSMSWNNDMNYSRSHENTGRSSSDGSSLANISGDSSSLSSLSSLQGNESDPVSAPITQHPVPAPLVSQYTPQTTYPYQYSHTGSYTYPSITDNFSYKPPYEDSAKHSFYPSLRSMSDVHW